MPAKVVARAMLKPAAGDSVAAEVQLLEVLPAASRVHVRRKSEIRNRAEAHLGLSDMDKATLTATKFPSCRVSCSLENLITTIFIEVAINYFCLAIFIPLSVFGVWLGD